MMSDSIVGLRRGLPREGQRVLAYLRAEYHPYLIAAVAWAIGGEWWTGLAGAYVKIGQGGGAGAGYSVEGWIDCIVVYAPAPPNTEAERAEAQGRTP